MTSVGSGIYLVCAPLGVFLALKQPTKGELSYAASLGTWQMPGSEHKYPVLQFMTIDDYFAGRRPDLPDTSGTLKRAKSITKTSEEKPEMGI